jgi:hypothetical protein
MRKQFQEKVFDEQLILQSICKDASLTWGAGENCGLEFGMTCMPGWKILCEYGCELIPGLNPRIAALPPREWRIWWKGNLSGFIQRNIYENCL